MRRNSLASATLATATFMLLGAHANAVEFSAMFSGFEEIGGLGAGETGAIFSKGKATLDLDLNRSARTITFNLTYSGLSAPVTQSHIHFGKEHVAGGVVRLFLPRITTPPPGKEPPVISRRSWRPRSPIPPPALRTRYTAPPGRFAAKRPAAQATTR